MRDVRISDAVLDVIGGRKAAELQTGPDPGRFDCVVCKQPGDADAEPISVLVYRYPRIINIVWAHIECAPSEVTWSDEEIDLEPLMAVHIIPILLTGEDGETGTPGLVMTPRLPVESAGQFSNAHLRTWLGAGLNLLASPDLPEVPPSEGWRAVLVPGEEPGLTRVTILCSNNKAGEPRTVASDIGIRVDADWLRIVQSGSGLVLYGGLTGLLGTTDRSPLTVVEALVRSARDGNLTGGLIDAATIDES